MGLEAPLAILSTKENEKNKTKGNVITLMNSNRWKLYINLIYIYSLLTNIYKIAQIIICTIYTNDSISNIYIICTKYEF